MRVLCVGRHAFLSEHLCRVFREVGAECEAAVGATEVLPAAARFDPDVVVSECDLLTPSLLDAWTREPGLAQVPVLAVSLTRRPDESLPEVVCENMAVVYLPSLDRERALALLEGANRPRGVRPPPDYRVSPPSPSTVAR
jgi:chemotaxis response regulator CheB